MKLLKQFLDEAEGVIQQGDQAEADNAFQDLHNSSDDTKAEFNKWFIIPSK